MIGRYQVTPNDIGRLTSADTLTMLQANIDKLPNGMFWYEATSGATSIYTNREVQRNATIAVWVRGESRCAVMFPFGTQVPYIMYRYGSGTEWTGFYKYGSETYATLGDLQTVNNAIDAINTQITNIQGDVSGLGTQVQTNTQNIANNTTEISTLDGRVDALETTVGNHTTEISTLDSRADSLETTVGNQATEIETLENRVNNKDMANYYVNDTNGLDLIFYGHENTDVLIKSADLYICNGMINMRVIFEPKHEIQQNTTITIPNMSLLLPVTFNQPIMGNVMGSDGQLKAQVSNYSGQTTCTNLGVASISLGNAFDLHYDYLTKSARTIEQVDNVLGSYKQPII